MSIAPDLPWVIPAIREILIADSPFNALVGGRIASRLPSTLPGPCVRLFASALPVNVPAGIWSPLVQVDVFVPPESSSTDPEEVSWNVAAKAASVLSTVRNRPYENMHFSVSRITDFLTDVDTTRGEGNPLYRGIVRAELIVHAR